MLADLDSTDKKKLTKVSFLSLASVFVLCVFIVSCFACSQDTPEAPSTEMTDEQKVAYWKAILPDTEWQVTTDERNNGILEGQDIALNAKIKYESAADKFTIYFVSSGVNLYSGVLVLSSSEGTITTVDERVWSAKFSEKNEILYLTIRDSNNKAVEFVGR